MLKLLMSFSLSGKRILITGATDGLGFATAKALAEQNAHIIVHGRTEEKVKQTVDKLRIFSKNPIGMLVCDLTQTETVFKTFSQIDNLDILINNAGIWHEGNSIETTPERIVELVQVNTLAPLLITRAVLPTLLKSEFAQIVSVVSIAGVEIPAGYFHTFYSATKFALQGFTEGLAKEYAFKNLRIMGYYPGGMNTDFFKKAGMTYKTGESWMFDIKESVEALIFMLTRDKSVNLKRMDLIKQ